MVETTTISVVSDNTVLVNKLPRVTDASSAVLDARGNGSLVFLFLKELALHRTSGETVEPVPHELWLGIGTIIEVTDSLLVVRYLPVESDVAVVGHSVHKPESALVVAVDSFTRELCFSRDTPISALRFGFFKVLIRNRICDNAGCLLLCGSKDDELCASCTEARDARKTRLVGPCPRCGREMPLISRFCRTCRAERRKESASSEAFRKVRREMLSWDEREEESYNERHGGA